MEKSFTNEEMLGFFAAPAFFVREGVITKVNPAAQALMLAPGMSVDALFATGQQEYRDFTDGCLYLDLLLQDQLYPATVMRHGEEDLFLTELSQCDSSLHAYTLAAKELRLPLAGVMTAAERLLKSLSLDSDPQAQLQAAQINQNLYKLLRIVGNMSDCAKFADGTDVHRQTVNISSILDELLQDVRMHCEKSGIAFQYSCPEQPIFAPVDQQKLERGVYNLISNALKFSRKDGAVRVDVVKRSQRLYITVTNHGTGIPRAIQQTIHQRYQRTPGMEDPSQGLGLGMLLARSAAAAHGGTVLMVANPNQSCQITMTLRLDSKDTLLRSPVMRIDYTGGRSHTLVELSDCLDTSLYREEELK